MREGGNEAMKRTAQLALFGGAALAAGAVLRNVTQQSTYTFRGKSVLITGGSRGLGLLLARHLANEGARLTLAGRSAESLQRALTELRSKGADVIAVACN